MSICISPIWTYYNLVSMTNLETGSQFANICMCLRKTTVSADDVILRQLRYGKIKFQRSGFGPWTLDPKHANFNLFWFVGVDLKPKLYIKCIMLVFNCFECNKSCINRDEIIAFILNKLRLISQLTWEHRLWIWII